MLRAMETFCMETWALESTSFSRICLLSISTTMAGYSTTRN